MAEGGADVPVAPGTTTPPDKGRKLAKVEVDPIDATEPSDHRFASAARADMDAVAAALASPLMRAPPLDDDATAAPTTGPNPPDPLGPWSSMDPNDHRGMRDPVDEPIGDMGAMNVSLPSAPNDMARNKFVAESTSKKELMRYEILSGSVRSVSPPEPEPEPEPESGGGRGRERVLKRPPPAVDAAAGAVAAPAGAPDDDETNTGGVDRGRNAGFEALDASVEDDDMAAAAASVARARIARAAAPSSSSESEEADSTDEPESARSRTSRNGIACCR